MLAFLLGRWIGTGLMVKFRPQDMLLVYALMNILLCGAVMIWGGMIGLYAMLAISFFMSISFSFWLPSFVLPEEVILSEEAVSPSSPIFGISGNGYCRQCLPATVDGLFHARQ